MSGWPGRAALAALLAGLGGFGGGLWWLTAEAPDTPEMGLMAASAVETAAPPPLPESVAAALPFAGAIGGSFTLTDHFGDPRSEREPEGRPQLLFFGYATCDAICSVALPRMAETVELIEAAGSEVAPIMVTVDPVNDTPEALRAAMPAHHPLMVGLTGSAAALAAAQAAFQVDSELLGETPDGAPIIAHGSFVYLLDADGRLLTLLPPILGPERMAEITLSYL